MPPSDYTENTLAQQTTAEIKRVKAVATQLLERPKTEKLQVDHWRDKESTRDAVRVAIRDWL